MSIINTIYTRLVLLSPKVEVFFRRFFWKHKDRLNKYNPFKHDGPNIEEKGSAADFSQVIDWLKSQGVGKGSLLVVHSSYDALKCTGLTPDQIIDKLLDLIGEEGTLAMPAMRKYKEMPDLRRQILENMECSDIVCTYNVRTTPVKTGILPAMLMRRKGAVTSLHPLDTMTALGPLAEAMMVGNIDVDVPQASHGPHSSWKYCHDHDALCVGLGVDLEHYNSMAHVAEEAYPWPWDDKTWYRIRKFNLIERRGAEPLMIRVKERRPKWTINLAEKRLNADLRKNNIVKRAMLPCGICMSIAKAKETVNFITNHKRKGYPYF